MKNLRYVMLSVTAALFAAQGGPWGALAQTGPQAAAFGAASVRTVDLKVGRAVSFIAADPSSDAFAVGFANCRVVIVDGSGDVSATYDIPGCKTLFRVRYGRLNGAGVVLASLYTGETAILAGGAVRREKTHGAAVTDSYVVADALLTASDDGSVRLKPMAGSAGAARTLTASPGVARNLLVEAAAGAGLPKIFVGSDSGAVQRLGPGDAAPRTFATQVGRINAMALAPDGQSVFVGGFDGRLRSIDLDSGAPSDLLQVQGWLNAIDVDPKGEWLGVAADDGLRLVALGDRNRRIEVRIGSAPLTALAFGRSRSVALLGDGDGLLHFAPIPPAP